jgi:flagellar biosynthesis protein FlhG
LAALRTRTAVRQVDVVVNGVRTIRSAQSVFGRLQTATASMPLSLRFLGHIPEDQNVRRAAMLRRPLVDLAPTSPASRAFERLTELLLETHAAPAAGVTLDVARQLDAAPQASASAPRPRRTPRRESR